MDGEATVALLIIVYLIVIYHLEHNLGMLGVLRHDPPTTW